MMITDNVRLVRELAEGGMGCVWVADHLTLETQVAVKFVSPESASRYPALAARFEREATMSTRIRSVHVVQSFDHGRTASGMPYIVMELLEGETLDDRLASQGPLSFREVAQVVAQVAKVLQHAHDAGIVHRDVKPENVFLTDQDYEVFVKLLDFGIAKRVAHANVEVTQTGIAVGTPGFISPEQALNAKHVDHRADLWSLGALAYNALTDRLAYGHIEGEAWWARLTQQDFPPPSSLRADLPPALDAWFTRALHPKPDQRFTSAAEMARTFAALASEPPPPLEPPRPLRLDKTINMSDGAPRRPESARQTPAPAQFDLFEEEHSEGVTAVMKKQASEAPSSTAPCVSSLPPATSASSLPPAPISTRPAHQLALAVMGAICLTLGAVAAALLHT
jgi:serine/threonine protein kinase